MFPKSNINYYGFVDKTVKEDEVWYRAINFEDFQSEDFKPSNFEEWIISHNPQVEWNFTDVNGLNDQFNQCIREGSTLDLVWVLGNKF